MAHIEEFSKVLQKFKNISVEVYQNTTPGDYKGYTDDE